LLPEGALWKLIAQGLKNHIDNEFQILSYPRQDLPGALAALPMDEAHKDKLKEHWLKL